MNGVVSFAGFVALLWFVVRIGRSKRTVIGASDHGRRPAVARHEGGHVVTARAVGGRVRSARLSAGPSPRGLVQVTLPDARAEIIFLMAGRAAGGGGSGCADDDAAIRRVLREFPSALRSQVRRECERATRQIVASRSGAIDAAAAKLDRRGRL